MIYFGSKEFLVLFFTSLLNTNSLASIQFNSRESIHFFDLNTFGEHCSVMLNIPLMLIPGTEKSEPSLDASKNPPSIGSNARHLMESFNGFLR